MRYRDNKTYSVHIAFSNFHICRFFSYNLRSPQLPAARQSEKQHVPGRTAARAEDGGATKSGAAAETQTLSNLLGAGGRGRFSGTTFSSELARHGGHCLRSLHRAGALVRAAPMASVHAATDAPSRASAMSPPPAIPIAAHAAAATHAPRSACDADTPAAGACGLRAPAAACSGGEGGPRRQQELMMVAAVEEGAAIYY
jgi:hypothetical protein